MEPKRVNILFKWRTLGQFSRGSAAMDTLIWYKQITSCSIFSPKLDYIYLLLKLFCPYLCHMSKHPFSPAKKQGFSLDFHWAFLGHHFLRQSKMEKGMRRSIRTHFHASFLLVFSSSEGKKSQQTTNFNRFFFQPREAAPIPGTNICLLPMIIIRKKIYTDYKSRVASRLK